MHEDAHAVYQAPSVGTAAVRVKDEIPTPFDDNLKPKPFYTALLKGLA
jgi:hypothetical protein